MVLSRRAAILAGIGALLVAVLGTWWAAVACVLVVALVILADWLLAPKPGALQVTRGGDSRLRLGEPANVHVLVANPTKRHYRLRIRDSWVPSAHAAGGLGTLDLPPHQRRRHDTVLTPSRRGDRLPGPVVLRAMGPLGIAGRQHHAIARWPVRVLPPFTSRKHLPSRVQRLRELDGRATILQRGQGTEFDSLREYVPGDDVRSIDWRATARSQGVVVKTWRPERDRHVLIVLDSGRTSAGRVGDAPRLDHLMDAALLLAALATKAGDRVDFLIVDRELRASVVKEPAGTLLNKMVDAMAPIEPLLAETHHRTLVQQALARVSQRSWVVLLTGLEGASVEDGLLPVLGPLRRKHRVTLATVADPDLDVLRADHTDADAVYAAAAAESESHRLQRVADRLRGLGVSVVSAPPERIAPELADHYLALKKAGQL